MGYNHLWIARGGSTIYGSVVHFEDNAPPACDTLYETTGVSTELFQILPFTLSDMWVVGVDYSDNTVIARHYNGATWASHLEAVAGYLYCAGGTTDDLWVGGADSNGWYTRLPILHHWNGATWTLTVVPTVETGVGSIEGFCVLSASSIYACGIVGPIGWGAACYPALWHYNGGAWSAVDTSSMALWSPLAIWAADASNIWIVGSDHNYTGGTNPGYNGRIYHYDGASTFTLQLTSGIDAWANIFHTVFGFSATDVWAAGAAVAHWNGATWTQVAHPVNPALFVVWQGMWGFATNDLYISGTSTVDSQTQFILHWNGVSLTQVFTSVAAIAPDVIHDMTALLAPPIAPQLVSAVTPDTVTVTVTFDKEMKHTTPSDPADTLHVANYTLTTILGIPRTVTGATLIAPNPTVIALTLSGEMTNGVDYTIEASNVESLAGLVIDPLYTTQVFPGLGILPQVTSATVVTVSTIEIVFNEAMLNTAALNAATSYHFTGPTTLTASSVTIVNPTTIRVLITGEMLTGGSYTVAVGFPPATGVQDLAWNNLDVAAHTAIFSGLGAPPRVIPTGVPKTYNRMWLYFNEEVETASAETVSNYTITSTAPPSTLAVIGATRLTTTTVQLDTADQVAGVLYTVIVAGVKDIAGNAVQPPYDVATFLGIGESPPEIDFIFPADNALNVDVRSNLNLKLVDTGSVIPGRYGVNQDSIWARVSYTISGVYHESYAVYGGEIQYDYIGEIQGDPLTVAGITFVARPKRGWPENVMVTIYVYGEDIEGASNAGHITFFTKKALCFEDNLPTIDALETKLLTSLSPFENAEKLRRLMLECCSESSTGQVRARTLMYFSAVTDMRTFLAGSFDFSLVNDILLCNRRSMVDVYKKIIPYIQNALAAINDLNHISLEAKTLLKQYLNSNSPVYVVNAFALAVVLTALLEVA